MRIGPVEFARKVIIGRIDNPLMIRWALFRVDAIGIYIHKFCRSDYERALHDHPWPFISVILRGGYFETHNQTLDGKITSEWRAPGSVLLRPAEWRHRVEIDPGKTSWSLVIVGRRSRAWGFFLDSGWCWWRKTNYDAAICEDGPIHHGGKD